MILGIKALECKKKEWSIAEIEKEVGTLDSLNAMQKKIPQMKQDIEIIQKQIEGVNLGYNECLKDEIQKPKSPTKAETKMVNVNVLGDRERWNENISQKMSKPEVSVVPSCMKHTSEDIR
jgi:hypothetical protein